MFLWGALDRLRSLAPAFDDPRVAPLMRDIQAGISAHGVVADGGGATTIYAYEVDGLGGTLARFDDANLPSLLAAPLFYRPLDRAVYATTRAYLLSPANSHFFR